MIDITTICPSCGGDILIEAEDFQPIMPVYDEQGMEAHVNCPSCSMGYVTAEIFLVDTDDESMTIKNVRVSPGIQAN